MGSFWHLQVSALGAKKIQCISTMGSGITGLPGWGGRLKDSEMTDFAGHVKQLGVATFEVLMLGEGVEVVRCHSGLGTNLRLWGLL